MQATTGIINVVQESRFRLATDDGRSELFILSRKARLEPQDLEALIRRGMRVTVHHDKAPELEAALAHDITEPTGRYAQREHQP